MCAQSVSLPPTASPQQEPCEANRGQPLCSSRHLSCPCPGGGLPACLPHPASSGCPPPSSQGKEGQHSHTGAQKSCPGISASPAGWAGWLPPPPAGSPWLQQLPRRRGHTTAGGESPAQSQPGLLVIPDPSPLVLGQGSLGDCACVCVCGGEQTVLAWPHAGSWQRGSATLQGSLWHHKHTWRRRRRSFCGQKQLCGLA